MTSSKPSKSARKRENLELQSIGERLIDLTGEQLQRMSLDERLLEAVRAAQDMKAHGALRRQRQLIGKLMRDVDPEPIRVALNALGQHDNQAKDVFRASEKWRDRITNEGISALAEFFALTGGENRELRELANAYASATHEKAQRLLRRRIFGEIHKELAAKVQSGLR